MKDLFQKALDTRTISAALVAVLLWHFGGGTVYAQARPLAKKQEAARVAKIISSGGSRNFDALLGELKDIVRQGLAGTKAAPEKGFAEIGRLNSIKEKLDAENEKNEAYFDALEKLITDNGLGDEMLSRHRRFVSDYQTRYRALGLNFEGIASAHKDATDLLGKLTGRNQKVDWDGPINKTLSFIDANTSKPIKRHFDPANLPHRSLKADNPIQPKLTRAEWDKALPTDFAGSAVSAHRSSSEKAPEISDAQAHRRESAHATRRRQPSAGYAATIPGLSAPTAADLAETIEVKFTPEIRALADSLGKNPVKIYNWVRNNIEFVPTWGSIQGAQLCMENRACNAFDTSSLLVALLRYSGVPARYQMGTIEVPIDKFKNWAGGFTNAEAAASLFASAGVPSVVRRVNQSGQVVSVRLEHVWVVAFADYAPSGAAIQAQSDHWSKMDAAFKQYDYSRRSDVSSAMPSDAETFVRALFAGSSINANVGSATMMNTPGLDSAIADIETKIRQSQSGLSPEQAITNLIGARKSRPSNLPLLAAGLPYKHLALANAVAEVPSVLRHTLTLKVEDDLGHVSLLRTLSLPETGGQQITLTYAAASTADADAVRTFGTAQSGGLYLPSAILVKPELYLNGQILSNGSSVRFGSRQIFKFSFGAPTITTAEVKNEIVAGEQLALGLDLSRVSPVQQSAQGEFFKDQLNLVNANRIGEISHREVMLRTLNNIISTWFYYNDLSSMVIAGATEGVTVRFPSAGICFLDLTTDSLFGAVKGAHLVGISMDVDRDVVISESLSGDARNSRLMSKIQGYFGSALEALIPQQFFSLLPEKTQWGSTATFLAAANQQGIPILRISRLNSSVALPTLNLPQEIKDEIADALNAGLVVTIPQEELTQLRVRGIGYIIEDPESNSAAYLISGGLSGGLMLGSLAGATDELFFSGAGQHLMAILSNLAGAIPNLALNLISFIRDLTLLGMCFTNKARTPELSHIATFLGVLAISMATVFAFTYLTANPVAISIAIGGYTSSLPFSLLLGDLVVSNVLAKSAVAAMKQLTGC